MWLQKCSPSRTTLNRATSGHWAWSCTYCAAATRPSTAHTASPSRRAWSGASRPASTRFPTPSGRVSPRRPRTSSPACSRPYLRSDPLLTTSSTATGSRYISPLSLFIYLFLYTVIQKPQDTKSFLFADFAENAVFCSFSKSFLAIFETDYLPLEQV